MTATATATAKGLLLLMAAVFVISPANALGEWEVVTEQNFSSQIRLNPHILLLVTVPWCGESRSLKNEITQLVTNRSEKFGILKLMVLYKNSEKILAQAIGAANGIMVLYYHHSVSYNYHGILRAWNILFSIHPYLLSSPKELPLKHLNSPKSLKDFVESTDKAFLLLEFCGWTPVLLSKLKNNATEHNPASHGNFSREVEIDRLFMLRGNDNQKKQATHNGNMMCRLHSGFGRIPWVEDSSFVNDTAGWQEIDGINLALGPTCTFEHFEQFSSFFSKLIAVAKEFSLPPERHGFGLVTERSLVSSLGVRESDSWLAVLQLAGCLHCSKILKVEKDIERSLKMENPIVTELEDAGQDFESSLPASKPAVILFVDRSGDSLEDRMRSVNALTIFRQVAAQHQRLDVINWETDVQPEKSINPVDQEFGIMSGSPRLKTTPKFKKIKLENQVSVMILDGDKNIALDNIASDLEGSSLQELLTNLLHRKKENKLSSIAKDVGFRLLSDDANIKILDTLSSQAEVVSSPDSHPPSPGGPGDSTVHRDEGIAQRPPEENDETESSGVILDSSDGDEKQKSEKLVMMETDKHKVSARKTVKAEIKTSPQSDSKEELVHIFKGLFFFSDANYPLLKALTGSSKIPSAVIIDPALQQHYVFQDEFSYASLADFLNGYLNGSLLPYKKSQYIVQVHREAATPPFVNLDFHEAEAIPRVTVNTFSKLVGLLNQSAAENANYPRSNDVLVLFSNSWCGFCQRMGLVVREVYRALKGCTETIKGGSRDNQMLVSAETSTNGGSLLPPLIYFMDCTLNDCGLILKSMNQKEVYPALTLFPAERNKVIPYEGDISVADIIEFLARYGDNSREFLSKKGILSTASGKRIRSSSMFDQASSSAGNEKVTGNDKLFEIILRNREPRREVQQNQAKPQSPTHSHKPTSRVKVGTFLIASDKLINAHPFDHSRILIVKADPETGFQGLIINKQLKWDSYPELGDTVSDLLKDAPLSFGGPVADPGIPFLALTRGNNDNRHAEIFPGVRFLDQSEVTRRIQELKSRELAPSEYWFFLGYSSWSYQQLFYEIEQGAWDVENEETGFAWP